MKTLFPYARWLGLGIVLASTALGLAQNRVTFQIDMTSQPAAEQVYVRGSFNNWGDPDVTLYGLLLTNDGSGIYTGSVDIAHTPGTIEYSKIFYRPGDNWEGDPNRAFVLAGGDQVLPLSAWSEKYPAPTNDVTFQVDMTAQVVLNAFTPGQTMRVAGAFTGWGDGVDLTNNPALTGSASNVYSTVIPVTGLPGTPYEYKFRANGGWESPSSTGGNNRSFSIAGGDQVLPLVFYNDASPCDLIQQDTAVKFRVHITNGTFATDGVAFDRDVNKLYINGEFLGWWTWNTGFGGGETEQFQLTNNPVGSDFYEQTLVLPPGKSLSLIYKYSMDGFDNEAGFGANHVRYVRSVGGAPYAMPLDEFGTNTPPVVETSFGSLKAGPVNAGVLPITWQGRQCVTLQVSTNLNTGPWVDVPATEGAGATNWPVNVGSQFFRLRKQ